MKVIALTGGIGSGKSTVAQLFELLDVPVYNSDKSAKMLMEQNQEIKDSLVHHFGSEIFLENGSLNRMHLSELIFNNDMQLRWINSLVHPFVGKDFDSWKLKQRHPYVLIESALQKETRQLHTVDKIIVVRASEPLRLSRVKNRNHVTDSGIQKRMGNQLSDDQLILHADYIIENEGHLSLIGQTLEIYKKLNKLMA